VFEVKILESVLVAALVATFGTEVLAQEREPQSKEDKPVVVRRFFDRPIDYWGRGLDFEDATTGAARSEKGPEARPGQKSQPSEWGQMVKLPDGTFSYRELPRPLVEVLDNPTPENIRAYFAFRMSRTQKILRAAELMKEYRASVMGQAGESAPPAPGAPPLPREAAGGPQERPLPESPPLPPAKATPFTVTYFHKKHCPHCDSQDVILAKWLKDKPEGKIEVIEFGMKPELWRATQVRGTPTLLIEDLETKRTVFMEGLTRAETLDRNLGECRAAGSREAAVKGDGKK
jgi:hypothetical protein